MENHFLCPRPTLAAPKWPSASLRRCPASLMAPTPRRSPPLLGRPGSPPGSSWPGRLSGAFRRRHRVRHRRHGAQRTRWHGAQTLRSQPATYAARRRRRRCCGGAAAESSRGAAAVAAGTVTGGGEGGRRRLETAGLPAGLGEGGAAAARGRRSLCGGKRLGGGTMWGEASMGGGGAAAGGDGAAAGGGRGAGDGGPRASGGGTGQSTRHRPPSGRPQWTRTRWAGSSGLPHLRPRGRPTDGARKRTCGRRRAAAEL